MCLLLLLLLSLSLLLLLLLSLLSARPCRLYVITRQSNPHFSPELQSKTTVVDFSVTMQGLEDQLLGVVIQHEQQPLEEQMRGILADVTMNTKVVYAVFGVK